MSEQYFVDIQGKTAGPFNLDELRGLYSGGSISDETLFCKPNAPEWLPLSMINGLLKIAKQAQPTPSIIITPIESAPAKPVANREDSICTACGCIGKPKVVTRGSFFIEVILWLFFIIPGVIYSIWRLTTRYNACRSCQSSSVIPVTSPQGQRMAQVQ